MTIQMNLSEQPLAMRRPASARARCACGLLLAISSMCGSARAAEPARARALLEARTNWILDQLEQVQNNITMRKETAH